MPTETTGDCGGDGDDGDGSYDDDGSININKQLKPMLERTFESAFKTTIEEIDSKCEIPAFCPIYFRSVTSLEPTLNIIGNISSSTGILILHE